MMGTLSASAGDLNTILDRNSDAHGGAAYARIQAIQIDLLISESSVDLQGTYLATRDGLTRIDMHFAGQRIFAEGLSEECAWS